MTNGRPRLSGLSRCSHCLDVVGAFFAVAVGGGWCTIFVKEFIPPANNAWLEYLGTTMSILITAAVFAAGAANMPKKLCRRIRQICSADNHWVRFRMIVSSAICGFGVAMAVKQQIVPAILQYTDLHGLLDLLLQFYLILIKATSAALAAATVPSVICNMMTRICRAWREESRRVKAKTHDKDDSKS